MVQNVLRAIGGIGTYDAISILIFVVVFTSALVWALRLKQPFLKSMSALPLDDAAPDLSKGDSSHD